VLGAWKPNKEFLFDDDVDDLLAQAIGLRDMELESEEIREW
jgi:hypothetical protein